MQIERQPNWHELIKTPSNNGLLTGLIVQINVASDRLGGLVDRLRPRRERGGGLRTGRAFSASPIPGSAPEASWDEGNQANSVSNERNGEELSSPLLI